MKIEIGKRYKLDKKILEKWQKSHNWPTDILQYDYITISYIQDFRCSDYSTGFWFPDECLVDNSRELKLNRIL
jgi:hypothetical protein